MKKFLFILAIPFFISAAYAEEKAKPCGTGDEVEKILFEKGYFHLLEMKNDQNGTVEQLWTGGRDMVISVVRDGKVCIVSSASEVTFNPQVIEKIYNIYKKSQKEL